MAHVYDKPTYAARSTDLYDLRAAAAQAITDINAYLLIADTATNVQVRAEVKQLAQTLKGVIKALGRVV